MRVPVLRRALGASVLLLAAVLAASACGSRGPLADVVVVEEVPPEAGADTGPALDASHDASAEAADAAADAVDAAPEATGFDGGPIVNCGTCVAQNCQMQILACAQSSGCRAALQCVGQTCLTGGTPNIQCLLGCTADGGSSTEQQLLGVFGCIVGNCGMQCGGVLGGLGGTGGGGGGGG